MRTQVSGHLIAVLLASAVNAVNNGLARTPQMGWVRTLGFRCLKSAKLTHFITEQLELFRLRRVRGSPYRHLCEARIPRPFRRGIQVCGP